MIRLSISRLASIKSKNILDVGELVERINKIYSESEYVSKQDQEGIAELYSEKLNKDLVQLSSKVK